MSERGPEAYDPLEDDYRDQLAAVAKGAVSLVPLVGGPLAEIIGVAIPNQRADRIAAYVRRLGERIDAMSDEVQSSISRNAAKLDLVVEGGYQAARAMSGERVERIAEAVSRGLGEGEADVVRRRRLLVIFGELHDDEVALLNAYGRTYGAADRSAFDHIDRPDPVHMQSPRADVERDRLFQAGREHLLRLDLLRRNFGTVRKGETPEFDARAGQFKHTVEVSFLGRLLLAEVGMPTPFDLDDAAEE